MNNWVRPTIEELTISRLRTEVHKDARSLKTSCKELLQKVRTVQLRDPDEYRQNCEERARLEGVLDCLIDYLADEDRAMNEEDGHGR